MFTDARRVLYECGTDSVSGQETYVLAPLVLSHGVWSHILISPKYMVSTFRDSMQSSVEIGDSLDLDFPKIKECLSQGCCLTFISNH